MLVDKFAPQLQSRAIMLHRLTVENFKSLEKTCVEFSPVSVPRPGEPAIGRIPAISEIVIAYTALTSGIGWHYFPATVLAAKQKGTAAISGLQDNASNYLQTLKEIARNLQDLNVRKNIIATLQRLNPTITALVRSPCWPTSSSPLRRPAVAR